MSTAEYAASVAQTKTTVTTERDLMRMLVAVEAFATLASIDKRTSNLMRKMDQLKDDPKQMDLLFKLIALFSQRVGI